MLSHTPFMYAGVDFIVIDRIDWFAVSPQESACTTASCVLADQRFLSTAISPTSALLGIAEQV